jgi:hypothetical protein
MYDQYICLKYMCFARISKFIPPIIKREPISPLGSMSKYLGRNTHAMPEIDLEIEKESFTFYSSYLPPVYGILLFSNSSLRNSHTVKGTA